MHKMEYISGKIRYTGASISGMVFNPDLKEFKQKNYSLVLTQIGGKWCKKMVVVAEGFHGFWFKRVQLIKHGIRPNITHNWFCIVFEK